MTTNTSLRSTHSISYYIHVVISLVLMLGVGRIPAFAPLTELGMQAIGIFLGMIWGWLFCSLVWPSIFGLVILGFTDYCTITQAFATGFSNNVVLIIIMMMGFLGIIQESGISEWLAYKMIGLKIAKGRPWMLTLLLWLTTIIMASIMGVVVPLLLMWEIVYTIAEIAGYKKGDAWVGFACAGIVVFSCIGCFLFPFTDYPVLVYGTFQALASYTEPITILPYMVCTFSFNILVALLYFLVVKYIFRPDVSKLKKVELDFSDKAGKLSGYQKLIIATIVVVFVILIGPSVLPAGNPIKTAFANIGILGVGALGIAIFLVLGFPKTPQNIGKIMGYVNWNIIFMMIGAMTMSAVLNDEATGFNAFISSTLTPFTEGKSGYALAAVIVAVALLMTQICNNNATSVMAMTIAYNILGTNSAISMFGMVVCIMAACDLALILPSGSAVSAMLFANDWVDKKIVFKSGFAAMIIGFAVCLLVVIPLSMVVF